MARIILVEDDTEQKEELQLFLMHAGHEVLAVGSGASLERGLTRFVPDIVLLDWNLPDEPGIDLAAKLRERFGSKVGLVMVTARSMAMDRVESRRAGIDNYLVKPIDFDELLVLIENLLQHLKVEETGDDDVWILSPLRSELSPPGQPPISLTGWEMMFLQALTSMPTLRADRDTLIRALGKNPLVYDPRALEANISRLRRKLPQLADGRNPLQAIRGVGYQFLRPLKVVN
ncbi:MAG: response regulator transcription factor [Gallionellaceae bacterium]|jgi:DNA-binding response OmpR family regulator|nr:response regulator transcription factor [Gallionellaceae bacterium]